MNGETIHLVARGLILIAAIGLVSTAALLAARIDLAGVALVSGLTGVAVGALASPLNSGRAPETTTGETLEGGA